MLNGNIPVENSAAARILLEGTKAAGLTDAGRSIAIMTKLDNPEGRVHEEKANYACKAIKGDHGVPRVPSIYASCCPIFHTCICDITPFD